MEASVSPPSLSALQLRIVELEDGIAEALRYLQADRKTLAIDALKAALTRETW